VWSWLRGADFVFQSIPALVGRPAILACAGAVRNNDQDNARCANPQREQPVNRNNNVGSFDNPSNRQTRKLVTAFVPRHSCRGIHELE
jgi:hypothetical protein